jgi:menaquinone-dependent protoporphyrinogen oxidase
LVTVASKHGATAEIGDAIARELEAAGHSVTSTLPQDVADVTGFDRVVIGSAVYAGRWQKAARELVDRLGSDLAGRAVWLFSSGPVGDPPKPDADPVDVAAIVESTAALGHRLFAGRLDPALLNFGERAIVTALRAPAGDFRDWDEIRAWALEIAAHA